jgi:ubiquinone/menaquinone biosynthesis C-methylase UbiE
MEEVTRLQKAWFEDGGGFFGRYYIEGDNSVEGYLQTPMTLEERTKHEINGVIKLLDLRPGDRVLDCPCGYGRHSAALAARDFEVVGCDINPEMLEPALKTTRDLSNVKFVRENMVHLNFNEEFDAVVNLFFSFGFFESDEENDKVLQNFYRALKPGGRFLMHTDINVPRIVSGTYKLHETRQLRSGRQLEIIETCDMENKRLLGTWSLLSPDGSKQELRPYTAAIYTLEDFTSMCEKAGFQNIRGYGDWEGTPLMEDSEDMIIVAEKPYHAVSA